MSTRKSALLHWIHCAIACAIAGALMVVMPNRGRCQQGAAVLANIDEHVFPAQHPQPAIPAAVGVVPEGFESLRLAPGSLLQMEVFGIPEMSAQLRVDAHGNVTIPLIGAVPIAGDTPMQAEAAIAKELVDLDILKAPQVLLNVLQFPARNISVLGEVQSPGRVQLLDTVPLADVLALVGGETAAAGNDIEIQRKTTDGNTVSRHVEYAQSQDSSNLLRTVVEPGDTVLVHREGIVYVLGSVNRPGGYRMVNGGALNVVQAISLAGGETIRSSTRFVVIIRRQGQGIAQIKVPMGKMEKGDEMAVPLQPDDVLFIPASTWKSFVINGASILSSAAAASIYAATSNP